MPPIIAQFIGGAGVGKTRRLLDVMAKVIERGVDPLDIGFVSFTRAARREASTRAAAQFGSVTAEQLEGQGWFRTLHSVCYKQLGAGKELLADSKADRAWLEESLQQPVSSVPVTDEDGGIPESFADSTDAELALTLWSAARNRLLPLETAWRYAEQTSDTLPSLNSCRELIDRYERAKRLDHRSDFTDLLGRFAGVRFGIDGHESVPPDGCVPEVSVWFIDEAQDSSPLVDAVARRLVEPSRWVYIVGDPFQSIFQWAGADPALFQNWDSTKREILNQSFRCPANIVRLGEEVLRDCSDYWDRGMRGTDRNGEIEDRWFRSSLFDEIDASDDWLILARTNFQARRLSAMLSAKAMPWLPTRGNGGWSYHKRHQAIAALRHLGRVLPVDGDQWRLVCEHIPCKANGEELLTRGTKAKFADSNFKAADAFPCVMLEDIHQMGATPVLTRMIKDGSWMQLIDGSDLYDSACSRWTETVVRKPCIRLGTIHSAKGAEADNVMVLTTTSAPISRALNSTSGRDQEARVWYVAATRARKRLVVANEQRAKHKYPMPL